MSTISDQLDNVLHKTSTLIELCNALQEENELFKQESDALKAKVNEMTTVLQNNNEKIRVLKLAKSIEGTSEKSLDIKQKINEFVREIDKCVVLLKK